MTQGPVFASLGTLRFYLNAIIPPPRQNPSSFLSNSPSPPGFHGGLGTHADTSFKKRSTSHGPTAIPGCAPSLARAEIGGDASGQDEVSAAGTRRHLGRDEPERDGVERVCGGVAVIASDRFFILE